MALIAMCVYDTLENKRISYTKETLLSLSKTVNFNKHKLTICDNNSHETTLKLYEELHSVLPFDVIYNKLNRGTARGINRVWLNRKEGQHCLKMDSDIVIEESGWLDRLEECVEQDPTIGIVGLKRTDCLESPNQEHPWYKSTLHMLPRKVCDNYLIVERVSHVMGSCQLYNSKLLDVIGYLVQPSNYGFDDSLAAVRCSVAGFYSCFYPHYKIHHIDLGDTKYQKDKEKEASEHMAIYSEWANAYMDGSKNIKVEYYD